MFDNFESKVRKLKKITQDDEIEVEKSFSISDVSDMVISDEEGLGLNDSPSKDPSKDKENNGTLAE